MDNSCVSRNDGFEDDDYDDASINDGDNGACRDGSGIVGDNSCRGFEACMELDGVVGDESCSTDLRNSFGQSCRKLINFSAGDGSCNDEFACLGINLEVGNGSCNGRRACDSYLFFSCYPDYGEGEPLRKLQEGMAKRERERKLEECPPGECGDDSNRDCTNGLVVGSNSCNGDFACYLYDNIEVGIVIGDNSCNCDVSSKRHHYLVSYLLSRRSQSFQL